jgi:hypothetical protein
MSTTDAAHRPPVRYLLAGLVLLLALVGWRSFDDWWNARDLPRWLQPSLIYYAKYGSLFGPGGNATILKILALPSGIAGAINNGGLSFIVAQPPEPGIAYREWFETPVMMDERWSPADCECLDPMEAPIGNFLRHKDPIEVNPIFVKMTNDALLNEGNYYAYGGNHSLLLIIPSRSLAVYAFVK